MNSVKTYLNGLGRGTRAFVFALAVVFVSAGIAQAATTISTSISTGGTLSVTGLATLLGGATTTQITLLSGDTIKNAAASTTIMSGVVQTTGGVVAQASSTVVGNFTTTGNAAVTGTLDVTGATTLASTTATSFKAGQVGTQMSQATFGYCSFTDVTLAASSTAGFTTCTTVPAGVLVAGDRVFVQATSSFESQYVITAASTTGVSTIQLRILNTGLGTADGTLSGTSVNFWALR